MGPNVLQASKLAIGVAGEYYDEIALYITSAAGNWRPGVYDDSGGNPNALLRDFGAFAASADYNYKTGTEFALTTNQAWATFNNDNGGLTGYVGLTGADTTYRRYRNLSYGALSDPFGSPTGLANYWRMKIGHS